ncbi:MAG: selenide, water dikinase SelD [Anaerolineales bacterium]|nr:selenide, water dikinase SelD [Anaerolineales bacterium]
MAQVLRPLQSLFDPGDYPELLAGLGAPDDAAVWRVDSERALVATTDFFTPVVDDPYDYGAIAAANSLSDVYAMGGQPFMALNVAALPPNLPPAFVAEILRGGAEMVRQAGVVLAGGHTIQDKEPKYGLVVMGWVHPQRMLTKGGALPGDVLLLSKPIGTGVITTALKAGMTQPQEIAEAVGWMKQLNQRASELALAFGARAATDITGFSLLGHACEMAVASGVGLRFHFSKIPLLESVMVYAAQWCFPGGSFDNDQYFGRHVSFAPGFEQEKRFVLFDPQTSGGLLMAVPQEQVEALMAAAKNVAQPLWVVGEVVAGEGVEVVK